MAKTTQTKKPLGYRVKWSIWDNESKQRIVQSRIVPSKEQAIAEMEIWLHHGCAVTISKAYRSQL